MSDPVLAELRARVREQIRWVQSAPPMFDAEMTKDEAAERIIMEAVDAHYRPIIEAEQAKTKAWEDAFYDFARKALGDVALEVVLSNGDERVSVYSPEVEADLDGYR